MTAIAHTAAPPRATASTSAPASGTAPVPAATGGSSASARISTARALAEQVIAERLGSAMLTVSNLCRWTGMSRSSLYRLFDADGGVQVFVRQCRLARVAEDLCRDPSIRVSDLAERWGFCDAAYLARVFREAYGLTPSAYRASHLPGSRRRARG